MTRTIGIEEDTKRINFVRPHVYTILISDFIARIEDSILNMDLSEESDECGEYLDMYSNEDIARVMVAIGKALINKYEKMI